jgi:hypothetical protein
VMAAGQRKASGLEGLSYRMRDTKGVVGHAGNAGAEKGLTPGRGELQVRGDLLFPSEYMRQFCSPGLRGLRFFGRGDRCDARVRERPHPWKG